MTTDADLSAELEALRAEVAALAPPEGKSPCWCCGVSVPDRRWRRDSMAFGVGLGGAGLCPSCWTAQPSIQDRVSRGAAALAGALGLARAKGRLKRQRRDLCKRVAGELDVRAWIDADVPATAEAFGHVSTDLLRRASDRIDEILNPPPPKVGEERWRGGPSYGHAERYNGKRWAPVQGQGDNDG